MKKHKKLISSMLLSIFVFVTSVSINSTEVNAVTAKTWLNWAWKIIGLQAATWFDRSPTFRETPDHDDVSSGSIEFNGNTYGPTSYHSVVLVDNRDEIDMFAQTNVLNWMSKIALVLFDPNGYEKASLSATHTQHLFYNLDSSDSLGTWKAQYVQTKNQTWDLWLQLWHYETSGHSNSATATYYNISSDGSISPDTSSGIKTYKTNNKTYFVPSSDFKTFTINTLQSEANYLDTKELSQQFFDNSNKVYVNKLKNYSVGESIKFKDIIQKIEYDNTNDITILSFNDNKNEFIDWGFNGDLRNRFKVGDAIKLNFKVVSEYSDGNYSFDTLDYIYEGQNLSVNGKCPDIDKYLIN